MNQDQINQLETYFEQEVEVEFYNEFKHFASYLNYVNTDADHVEVQFTVNSDVTLPNYGNAISITRQRDALERGGDYGSIEYYPSSFTTITYKLNRKR